MSALHGGVLNHMQIMVSFPSPSPNKRLAIDLFIIASSYAISSLYFLHTRLKIPMLKGD
jgi:hypothetical protein